MHDSHSQLLVPIHALDQLAQQQGNQHDPETMVGYTLAILDPHQAPTGPG